MRRTLVPLAIGCALVGVVATVLVIVGWQWSWFALANSTLRRADAGAVPRICPRARTRIGRRAWHA